MGRGLTWVPMSAMCGTGINLARTEKEISSGEASRPRKDSSGSAESLVGLVCLID